MCVKQTNIAERDSQVLLVRDIYKHAARTNIWLDQASSDPPTSLAFDLSDDFLRNNRACLHEQIKVIGLTYRDHCLRTLLTI
jgi:hypothetical protein